MADRVSYANNDGMNYDVDVLIVGAGPTGLALAAQLAGYGTSFRIIDRRQGPSTQSKALAVQPRTLEALRPFGISAEMAQGGTPARQLHLHLPDETVQIGLFDIGIEDSAHQQLLFLPQSETERLLLRYLGSRGVRVERGAELLELNRLVPDDPFAGVEARVQRQDRGIDRIRARYVVGADGAESTVRRRAGMDFRGSGYADTFVLADLEVDGAEPGAVHAYPTDDGFMVLFPLGQPASWRMISLKERGDNRAVTLEYLQGIADKFSGGGLKLHDPKWISSFRLSHQMAEFFQSGSVFLAGDAAHVHSPVGGQGMNTGIQDALNLGWKLALGAQGLAADELIDSYDAERRPVARGIVGFTDRLFKLATSRNALTKLPRTKLLPALAPSLAASERLRSHYRGSTMTGTGANRLPAVLASGPRPGDRLPDAVVHYQQKERRLQDLVSAPGFHVLLTGPGWPDDTPQQLHAALAGLGRLLSVQHLVVGSTLTASGPGIIEDVSGLAFERLGLSQRRPEVLVIRPDGYIGYRSSGTDINGAVSYLERLTGPGARSSLQMA